MPSTLIKKALLLLTVLIIIGFAFFIILEKGYPSPTDKEALAAIKKDLGTKKITIIRQETVDNYCFLGLFYDDEKFGLAVFSEEDERFSIEEIYRQEKMISRAEGISVVQFNSDYFIVFSQNINLDEIRFSGDFEGTLPVHTCPFMIVQKMNFPKDYEFSYEFYDIAGNILK